MVLKKYMFLSVVKQGSNHWSLTQSVFEVNWILEPGGREGKAQFWLREAGPPPVPPTCFLSQLISQRCHVCPVPYPLEASARLNIGAELSLLGENTLRCSHSRLFPPSSGRSLPLGHQCGSVCHGQTILWGSQSRHKRSRIM